MKGQVKTCKVIIVKITEYEYNQRKQASKPKWGQRDRSKTIQGNTQ